MAEYTFADNVKHSTFDKQLPINVETLANDATPFRLEATLHYHDKCMGVQRVLGWENEVRNYVKEGVGAAIRRLGAESPSNDAIAAKVLDPQGRNELQDKLKKSADEMLGNFCLEGDGVAITKVRTGP